MDTDTIAFQVSYIRNKCQKSYNTQRGRRVNAFKMLQKKLRSPRTKTTTRTNENTLQELQNYQRGFQLINIRTHIAISKDRYKYI